MVCQFGALLVVIPGSILLYNTLAFPLNDINKILLILIPSIVPGTIRSRHTNYKILYTVYTYPLFLLLK